MSKLSDSVNQDTTESVKDSKTGRFIKGKSGNPGGISKEKKEIVELCKSMSEDVINTLYSIVMDTKQHGMTRIAAGTVILDRGFGKPGQRKEENEDETYIPPQMIINMSKEDYEEYLKEQQE